MQDRLFPRSIGILLIGGLVLGGCSGKEGGEKGPVVSVQIAQAQSTTIERKVTADAVLYPLEQAAIVSKISAPVRKFYVNRGSRVRAGQLLAELENQDLAASATENKGAYEQAEATYEITIKATLPQEIQKAELDLKAAKESLDAQQKVYENRQALFKQGAIARKDLDDATVNYTQARNQYELAKKHLEELLASGKEAELKAAGGQLTAAKGKYLGAQAQLSYSEIRSPINGVVTDRPLYPGEMAPAGTPIVTVMDLSRVVARAHISQQLAAGLHVGDSAKISVPGESDDASGKVTIVSPALDPNSTTVEVWVQAVNPGERLKPGTSVRVTIVAETVHKAVVVPTAAILTAADGATSVMVVDSDNKPHQKNVKLGIRDGENVQIAEGLRAGERVVTVGAFELSKEDPDVLEKTKVQVETPKTPEKGDEKGSDEDKASDKDKDKEKE